MSVGNNSFSIVQNEPDKLELLLARRQVQKEATTILSLQIALVILGPAILGFVAFIMPTIKPQTALYSIVIAVIDIFIFDRMQKKRLALGARLQEEFDCLVFGFAWDKFIAGSKIDRRIIARKGIAYERKHGNTSVLGWYSADLAILPGKLAVLAAQRLNLEYDYAVRSPYKNGLIIIALLVMILCAGCFFETSINISSLILGLLVPIGPIVNWCSREFFRQHDAISKLQTVQKEAANLWDAVVSKKAPIEVLDFETKLIQAANFIRRSNAPMVFEKIYWLRRGRLEKAMQTSAQIMINQYISHRS